MTKCVEQIFTSKYTFAKEMGNNLATLPKNLLFFLPTLSKSELHFVYSFYKRKNKGEQ